MILDLNGLLFGIFRELLVFLEQFKGQRLRKSFGIGRFIGGIRAFSLVERVRIGLLKLLAAVFNDALCHIHCQRICFATFVQYCDRFGEGEVSLGRIYKINGKSICLICDSLMPQAEANGDLACAAELQWARAGGFDVIAGIFIDICQDLLCPVLTISVSQSLDQQPRCGRGLDVGNSQLAFIYWRSQILDAGGTGGVPPAPSAPYLKG